MRRSAHARPLKRCCGVQLTSCGRSLAASHQNGRSPQPRSETFSPLSGCRTANLGTRMAEQTTTTKPTVAAHGATVLPAVEVDSYNVELKDDEGFLGDRASKGAFREFVENWRKPLRKMGMDPLGDQPTEEINKKKLDTLLKEG